MADELRPPAQWAHLRWHFVKNSDGIEKVLEWSEEHWNIKDRWFRPQDMTARGWTYHGAAVAVTGDDAQVERVARAMARTTRYQIEEWGSKIIGNDDFAVWDRHVRAVLAALIGEK